MTPTIICMVGDQKREIDFDLFVEVHTRVADYYKSMGFEGDKLDIAIVEALPSQLAKVIDGAVYH